MNQIDMFGIIHDKFKVNKSHVKLFEAFAGYGAFHMTMKRLGWNVDLVGYSEIDKYAIKVYEELHNAHGKNYGAIGSFDRLPKDIDICTWSFPCQDISLAGKQRGMVDGSRSNYGFVFLDTVANTPYNERPKVLIMENVRALFSEKFREDWREIQRRLDAMGYTSYSEILNAKDYGVAQNRERVFIVSILGGGFYEFPKPIPPTKRLKDYLEDEVDEKYYLSAKQIQSMIESIYETMGGGNREPKIAYAVTSREFKQRGWLDECPTLCARDYKDPKVILIPEAADNFIVKSWNDESKVYKTKEDDMPRHRIYDIDSVGFTITTNESQQPMILIPEATEKGYAEACDGDGIYINTIKTSVDDIGVVIKDKTIIDLKSSEKFRRKLSNEISPSLLTDTRLSIIEEFESVNAEFYSNNPVIVINGKAYIIGEDGVSLFRIRKLTPREALRLMDVLEDDINIILSLVSNTQAYKLAGNSIVVNVLVEMLRSME